MRLSTLYNKSSFHVTGNLFYHNNLYGYSSNESTLPPGGSDNAVFNEAATPGTSFNIVWNTGATPAASENAVWNTGETP